MNEKKKWKLTGFLVQWEMILIYLLFLINILLMLARPNLYFASGTITSIIQSGMDLCPLVLGMALVMMMGEIDVSCAANMIFCSMTTGLLMDRGVPAVVCVLAGIATGVLLGMFNGVLVGYVGMPSVIVTISNSLLYRGVVKIILDVNVLRNFPAFYTKLAWNQIAGIPLAMIIFLLMAAVFVVILQKTGFGRKLYIIGNNAVTAEYSGINVRKTKLTVYLIMGVMCGIASIFFVGRMGGGVSSTMGVGYEMNAIAICALGGISTSGGKGKMYGPIISTFIMAFLIYTLGLMGVDANAKKTLTGLVLLIAVLIPNINKELFASVRRKFRKI